MAIVQSEGQLLAAHRAPSAMMRGLDLYTGEMATYAELYRRQPNVRLVNGFLARNIAQLGLHAFDRVSDDERRRFDPAHPLTRLIRKPNPYVTRYRFIDALVHDLGIYDVWLALKLRNAQTGDLRLFRIPPYMVKPVGDSWLFPDGYVIEGNKAKLEVTRDQVVVIHGYNPSDALTGLSTLESLRRVLAEDAAAGEWREQYWRNAARISGVIQRPVDAARWSDTARARFRSDFQTTWSGNGQLAGATPILEEGMTWVAAAFSSQESEYLSARKLSREETAASYFISPLFVGILDHANFSNVAEQHKHLYQDTLGPRLVEIEEEFELQILPEFPQVDPDTAYFEFNLAEKLKGTFEEQAAVMSTMVGAPILTRDEGRSRLNLPPLPGGAGAQIVTPLNVLVGGQASPRDTAPPPAIGTGAAARKDAPRALPVHTGTKALPVEVTGWHAKHVEVLDGFFGRQKAAVVARIGAGQHPAEAFDDDRWNNELEADLLALSVTMATDVAAPIADRFGGTYDPDRSLAYLATSSRIAAENINASTKTALTDAWTAVTTDPTRGQAARRKDVFDDQGDPLADDESNPDTPVGAVAAVFALALASRADEIATSRATSVGNFARHDAADQFGVPYKTWQVNSARPRAGHPADGETVPLNDTFSNGGRWPGDAEAGVDQTAGCTCSMDFTLEAP